MHARALEGWSRAFLFHRGSAWLFYRLGLLHVLLLGAAIPACAQEITLQTAPGGVAVSGSRPNFSTGFGAVNGLGIGTPVSGATVVPTTGGVFYTTPYYCVISGAGGGNPAVVRAFVSTNFVHPLILQVYGCISNCTSASSYTAISTSSASPTDIIPQPGISTNSTVTRYLGLFVSNQNGAAAFTGTDSAVVTYNVYNGSNNQLQHQEFLTLNNPLENVQTALQFLLATASGGVTITVAADFAVNFGNVNGLGIGPAAGLSVSSVTGGQLYSTPYLLQPTYSSFSSTTGTLKVYVSTDFANPSQLELRDSSAAGGPFNAISKSAGSQTTITSAASSGSTVTRYLGLFVSNANGPTIFTGADNATLTYTLVVP